MPSSEPPVIAVAWSGLPVYAAAALRADAASYSGRMLFLATRPKVPLEGIEKTLGASITWLDTGTPRDWSELGLPVPDHMILTGWGFPAFNHLRDTVRGRGGRIVAMVDNCWKGNARQWVGAVYARLKLRSKIDAVWVPGASAESLCRRFGWPAKRIYRSLYSALDGFTASPEPLSRRPKTFLFVGQLIPRKGVDTLARAWQAAGLAEAGWTLEVCGAGPAQSVFDGIAGVRLTGFLQPAELPAVFQRSRWFVLPAREEHWGLVVHEAARAGCGLLLSDQVGARHEFLEPGRSGWCFAAGNPDSLAASLRQAAAGSGEAIDSLGRRALELGSGISTRTHVASFQRLSREVFGIDASLLR